MKEKFVRINKCEGPAEDLPGFALTEYTDNIKKVYYLYFKQTIVLGRTQNKWPKQDFMMSRVHARVTFEDNHWFAEDLGSTHGITVNGTPIAADSKVEIYDYDRMFLGETCLTFFSSSDAYEDEDRNTFITMELPRYKIE